jgi:uncharacterized protein (UPF0335 family)
LAEVDLKLDNDTEPYGLNQLLESTKNRIEELEAEKKRIIKEFDIMMGPALREGYW